MFYARLLPYALLHTDAPMECLNDLLAALQRSYPQAYEVCARYYGIGRAPQTLSQIALDLHISLRQAALQRRLAFGWLRQMVRQDRRQNGSYAPPSS